MPKLSFDASTIAPAQPFDPVPAGWYTVAIEKSDIKPVKAGPDAGTLLSFESVILAGDFKGRRIFGRLNFKNKSAQAQEIGQQQLSALCHATGVIRLNATEELHGKPFDIKVSIKPAEGQYSEANEVKSFRACKEGGHVAPASNAPAPAWAGKKPAPPAPAKPAAPPPPAKAKTPPPPPKPKDDRKFFCYINGETSVEVDAAAVANNMNEYGLDMPVCLVGSETWGVGADFEIEAGTPPAAETPPPPTAPNPATPPWARGKK